MPVAYARPEFDTVVTGLYEAASLGDLWPEALEGLAEWAFKHRALKALIAHTPVALVNSQRVLMKAGFEQISENEGLILWRKLNAN